MIGEMTFIAHALSTIVPKSANTQLFCYISLKQLQLVCNSKTDTILGFLQRSKCVW